MKFYYWKIETASGCLLCKDLVAGAAMANRVLAGDCIKHREVTA